MEIDTSTLGMITEDLNSEEMPQAREFPTLMTTLPYEEDMEPEIAEKGAIIDMSRFYFPSYLMEDPIKTAFIYLRNTNYDNLIFDFSNCSYELRKEFLIKYLQTNMHFPCHELISTWLFILNYYQGFIFNRADGVRKEESNSLYSILSNEEIDAFISEYKEILDSSLQFIQSLPIYLIIRLKTDIKVENDIPKFEGEKKFGKNIYFFAKNPACNLLMVGNHIFEPLDFTDEFTEENNELFESLTGLDFYQYIRTLATEPETWNSVMSELQNLDKALEDGRNE